MKIKIFIFLLLLFFACVEFEPVSPIPNIKYKSINFVVAKDSVLSNSGLLNAVLEFDFVDGDADLGVYDEVHNDENLPDSVKFGIFIDLYEKVDGEYFKRYIVQPIDTFPFLDTFELNTLLPYDQKMDRVGQNKTIQGIIRSSILFSKDAPFDTMMLEFYIRDRALNKSNIERTDDFSVEALNSVFNNFN